MKRILLMFGMFCVMVSHAQNLPVMIPVPAVHSDPNVNFSLLNLSALSKDRFSVVYYMTVYGSAMHGGEFVRDTGGTVYSDANFKEMVPYSNAVILVRKQVFDLNGNVLETIDWLLAQRRLNTENTVRFYFGKGMKHPVVENRVKLTQSIYDAGALSGLTPDETAVLSNFVQQYIPKSNDLGAPAASEPRPGTIAGDLKAMKAQFKSLKEASKVLSNDLPSGEKLLTRFPITENRIVAVTRTKGDVSEVKFYITEDYKAYHFIDSDTLMGDLTVTAAAPVYDTEALATGAMVNLHAEYKNEKGEKVAKMHTFFLNADYKLNRWEHVVGKNKLNSMSPELAWLNGNQLYVMTNNREKIFKPYAQVHRFEVGKPGEQLFPLNDEEKGSEKTKYVKNLQPEQPVQTQTMAPIPDNNKPLMFLTIGGVQYIITQGTKYNDALKSEEYLTLHIYKIDANGKLIEDNLLSDVRGNKPFGIERLITKNDAQYLLLPYNHKIQLIVTANGLELQKITDEKSNLMLQPSSNFAVTSLYGVILFKQTNQGKNFLLYYPL